jgi:hypothetical protein
MGLGTWEDTIERGEADYVNGFWWQKPSRGGGTISDEFSSAGITTVQDKRANV